MKRIFNIFNLPVIFFIENNQYAEFTPLRGHTKLEKLSHRAKGYGIKGITIDGNDVWEVYNTVKNVRSQIINSSEPVIIEAITYRFCGHTEGESAIYRKQEEVEEWRKKDPILKWKKHLMQNGLISEEEVNKFESVAEKIIGEAWIRL